MMSMGKILEIILLKQKKNTHTGTIRVSKKPWNGSTTRAHKQQSQIRVQKEESYDNGITRF